MNNFENEYRKELNKLRKLTDEFYDLSEQLGDEVDPATKARLEYDFRGLSNEGLIKQADPESIFALKLSNSLLEAMLDGLKSEMRYIGSEKVDYPEDEDEVLISTILEALGIDASKVTVQKGYYDANTNEIVITPKKEQAKDLIDEKTYDFEDETISMDKILQNPTSRERKDNDSFTNNPFFKNTDDDEKE